MNRETPRPSIPLKKSRSNCDNDMRNVLTALVWHGALLLALYNYNGLCSATTELVQFLGSFHSVCFCVPCSSSAHRAPGKKAAVPIYKLMVRLGRKSNSRPTSTEADALTTRPRAGRSNGPTDRVSFSEWSTHHEHLVNCVHAAAVAIIWEECQETRNQRH